MQRVIHFEIYTRDPEAVCPFYQDVFGWKFKKFEGGPIDYWVVTTGDDARTQTDTSETTCATSRDASPPFRTCGFAGGIARSLPSRDGKEGVSGSSPEEGSAKVPETGLFLSGRLARWRT